MCICFIKEMVFLWQQQHKVENKQLRTGKWCTFVHLHSGDFICICYSCLIWSLLGIKKCNVDNAIDCLKNSKLLKKIWNCYLSDSNISKKEKNSRKEKFATVILVIPTSRGSFISLPKPVLGVLSLAWGSWGVVAMLLIWCISDVSGI